MQKVKRKNEGGPGVELSKGAQTAEVWKTDQADSGRKQGGKIKRASARFIQKKKKKTPNLDR